MGGCCKKNNDTAKQPVKIESAAKTFVNNLKSSIFCGTKGFLTFSLAFLSYLEYSAHHNTKLKEGAAFAMKRNTVPFFEMAIITPFVCFALPAMVRSMSLMDGDLLLRVIVSLCALR